MLCSFLSKAAQDAGFNIRILEAKDGEEALSLFAKYKSVLSGIWTDNQMPHITGVELIERIKGETKIPIVLFSADDSLPFWEGSEIMVFSKNKRREAVAWFISRLR
jgi:CheY-like chemotaxis protein